MTSTIFANQPNRKSHNWLIYKIGEKSIKIHKDKFKGVLYDLGCGDMPVSFKDWLDKRIDKYIGVDWGESPHKLTANIIADLNKILPINDKSADTVISLSVLEHLSEPQTMVNEAFRILKNKSYFILQVPFMWHIHEQPYDYFRYTPFGLINILSKAGFKNIKVEAQAGFFSMLFLKINYFSLRLIRGPLFFRFIIKNLFRISWVIGQLIAPYLDRLDKSWDREATGYFVTAYKY